MRHRLLAVVAVALLVAFAGCSGQQAQPTPTTTSSAGTATTTSQTPQPGSAPSIVAPPLNASALRSAHLNTLEATTYTVDITRSATDLSTNTTLTETVLLKVGQEKRIKLVRNTFESGVVRKYQNATGTAYARNTTDTGNVETRTRNVSIDTRRVITPAPYLDMIKFADLTYNGQTQVNGETRYVYTISGKAPVDEAVFNDLDYNKENVTAFSYRLELSENGVVKSSSFNFTVKNADNHFRLAFHYRVTNVGTTTTSPPAWWTELQAQQARPDLETVTRSYSSDAGSAVATVQTRNRDAVSITRGSVQFATSPINKSQVGPAVAVSYTPAATKEVTITINYRESAVPNGNESALRLILYDDETGKYVPLATGLDNQANQVHVVLSQPGSLSRLQGDTVFLIQYQYYQAQTDDTSS